MPHLSQSLSTYDHSIEAKPSRFTLQPISESKRVMSNPSRAVRAVTNEGYDAAPMMLNHPNLVQDG